MIANGLSVCPFALWGCQISDFCVLETIWSKPFEEWLKSPKFAGYIYNILYIYIYIYILYIYIIYIYIIYIYVYIGYIMLDPHFIVSIHGGTSKSSLLIVVSTINHPFI